MYATVEDFKTRLGQSVYTSLYGTTGPASDDLASASAEIDGAVSVRYVLPVSGTGSLALLRDWNLTLGEERAFARPCGSKYSEKVKQRVQQVREYLQKLQTGEFRLPDAREKGTGDGVRISTIQCSHPVFSRADFSGY